MVPQGNRKNIQHLINNDRFKFIENECRNLTSLKQGFLPGNESKMSIKLKKAKNVE